MTNAGLSGERLGRMCHVLGGYVERGDVPGLVTVVSRRGETHIEALGTLAGGGREPMAHDTIFRIASMTKPVTAVAAMILVEECRLRLDDPVDEYLPELADRRVLTRLDSPLDETVPAARPITTRDLLSLCHGMGMIARDMTGYPIRAALDERLLLTGPPQPGALPAPDEWIRQLGELPLMYQPGERWTYDLGSDVLGVLVARVAGQSLEAFMGERIFAPLGMNDTAFSVPPEKIDRLATAYETDHATGGARVFDAAEGGQWSRPPAFHSGGGGLVSTAADYLAFGQMLLNGGRLGSERILSRRTVELMTSDHLTPEQRAGNELFLSGATWGFGLSIDTVDTARADLWTTPGRYGWTGGLGTSWANDPREDLVAILLTQRALDSPSAPGLFNDFWTLAYQSIDD